MPVTIDEVTAEVAPPAAAPPAAPGPDSQPPKPSQLRVLRQQFERMQQRAARVKAD